MLDPTKLSPFTPPDALPTASRKAHALNAVDPPKLGPAQGEARFGGAQGDAIRRLHSSPALLTSEPALRFSVEARKPLPSPFLAHKYYFERQAVMSQKTGLPHAEAAADFAFARGVDVMRGSSKSLRSKATRLREALAVFDHEAQTLRLPFESRNPAIRYGPQRWDFELSIWRAKNYLRHEI